MAKEKSTTVTERTVNGKVTNPRDLQFPHDEHGFTTMLRKEGARAVGRISGDEAKLKVFIDTLKVLGEHARTKTEAQKKDIERQLAAARNREEAEYARSIEDQKREVSRLEKLTAAAKAQLQAKMEMPEGTGEEE